MKNQSIKMKITAVLLLIVCICGSCVEAPKAVATSQSAGSEDANQSVDDAINLLDDGKQLMSDGTMEESDDELQTSEMMAEEISEERSEISLVMVGDMLMHMRVTQSGEQNDGTYNYDHFFQHVKEDISEADLALVNQEIILGGEELGFSGYPIFNTAYEVADALDTAGFDVVLHATNHAMDKGKKGLMNCMGYWEENYPNVEVLGIHDTEEDSQDIFVYEQDGMKVAILNYTYGLNGMPMPSDMPYAVDLLQEDQVRDDITAAREEADFIIVCPHWGTEYKTVASTEQKRWTQIFLEEGVDLVIGTHPHVIEPITWVEDEAGNQMLVYYSLGNFINSTASEGKGVAKRVVGGMAKVNLCRNAEGEVVIAEYGVEPLVTQIIAGQGLITTYKLSDYTEALAKENEIRRRDSSFSYEFCIDLCDEVFGELADGEMKTVLSE